MEAAGQGKYVGQRIPRREDIPILRGTARYIADIALPGMLHAKILRSPYPHARIVKIDPRAAQKLKGVVAIVTADDLRGSVHPWGHLQTGWPEGAGDRFPLALEKVRYVGDAVAAVVATDRYTAQDALELIKVDYEELEAVLDPEAAMKPGAPIIHERVVEKAGIQGNLFFNYHLSTGDIEDAEKTADLVVSETFQLGRQVCAAMEPHGCVAHYDGANSILTIWTSTQAPVLVRDVAAMVLSLPAHRVRVIAPNVGGAFGSKGDVFPHEILAAVLSMRIGHPVRIVLERGEVFQIGTGRVWQTRYSSLYLKRDGTIIGWKERIIQDDGAHATWGTEIIQIGTQIGLLPYKFPNVSVEGYCVYTNKPPGGPVRGFGTPQTIFVRESLVDMAAERLSIDPAQLRLRNVVRGDECPITTPLGQEVDSTSIDRCIQQVCQAIGWERLKKEKPPLTGVGLACSMKLSSARHPVLDSDLDSVRLRVETDGSLTIFSSACPHGTGVETSMAQVCADEFGVEMDRVSVITGDTMAVPIGLGTWGSRTAVISLSALRVAARKVKEKLLRIAAHLLKSDPKDLALAGGKVTLVANPQAGIPIADLAAISHYVTHLLPPGIEPGPIEETGCYDSPTGRVDDKGRGNMSVTYSSTAHAAVVSVDPDTGKVKVADYAIASDHGTVINPLIVEGQEQGGFAMGLGMALGETLIFDEAGQLLNGSFRDYYLPLAVDVPSLGKLMEIPAPSTKVPGGSKGAAESSAITVPAAIANAVADAIGARITNLPLTPERVFNAMKGWAQ